MSHYEERLEKDLAAIRAAVVAAGRYAEAAFERATDAMLRSDREVAYDVVLGDLELNRDIRELNRQCHAFIARHLPSAGHLRFVSAVLQINVYIERVGDYAVTLGRETAQLTGPLSEQIAGDLAMMAQQSLAMLRQAIDALETGNAEFARGTMAMEKRLDTTFAHVFKDLVTEGNQEAAPLADLFALLVTFNRVERVSDLAKNICEEIIFAETGETKVPKRYRVVFVDERNDTLSVIAGAIAAKAYPESGEYQTAGWQPAAALEPGFELFMDERGHAVEGLQPRAFADLVDGVDDAHVIVSLQGDPRPHIGEIPYHTVLQIWDVGLSPAANLDRERADAILEIAYKAIALRVEELMTRLRGPAAA